MYLFAAAQQTNTTKLPVYFQRFQTKVCTLTVNETKITTENAFSRDDFGTDGSQESRNDKTTLFWIFLQICDSCFNP